MGTREEMRVAVDKPVVLTVLRDPELRLPGRVKDASPHGLGIYTGEPVPPGSPIKIEIGDALFLGEAVYCRALNPGCLIGVRFTQVLSGLAALGKMARDFDELLHTAPRGDGAGARR